MTHDPHLTDLALNVLLALARGPRHGYAIIKDIEARAGAPGGLRSGTLYTALRRLSGGGLVEAVEAPGDADARRKYFGLTAAGREAARVELQRLRALVREGVRRDLVEAEGR